MPGHKHHKPRRNRKRNDRKEVPSSFLPQNNPRARTAYLCALFGFIPGVGLLLGPFAVIFGFLGFRDAKTKFEGNGLGHSFVSIVLGLLEVLTHGAGLVLLSIDLGWI